MCDEVLDFQELRGRCGGSVRLSGSVRGGRYVVLDMRVPLVYMRQDWDCCWCVIVRTRIVLWRGWGRRGHRGVLRRAC